MSLFGKIIATAINVATLPVAVAKDVVTLGGVASEEGRSFIVKETGTDKRGGPVKPLSVEDGTPKADFVPNYRRRCIVCGGKPTIDIKPIGGAPKQPTDMCGVCTWGEADCADPENW